VTARELQELRREYEAEGLVEEDMADDPLDQFRSWFDAARESGTPEPNAFVLATVDRDGTPSARALLVKEVVDDGIVFYTGLESRKSLAMEANPLAAATFAWIPLHRQVRLEGRVAKVEPEQADAYFATRPRGAQIAAHASRQSELTTKDELDTRYREVEQRFGDSDIPRPDHWGGWKLSPTRVEFWQGQPNRFHDRVRYRLERGEWVKERLAP
jgi:pyridoxamine 5'-phosphate oxidase